MIGLGKWTCTVKSMLFSGDVRFEIFDDNGSYGFKTDIPGISLPDISVISVTQNGNDVNVIIRTSLLPGKDIVLDAFFDGDSFEGTVKIPLFGKVKLRDGKRIA